MIRTRFILWAVIAFSSLSCQANRDTALSPKPVVLDGSIGIVSLAGYTELIPAGQNLPHTIVKTFGNAHDNLAGVTITLAQEHGEVRTQITEIQIEDLPLRPPGALFVNLSLSINAQKQLQVKVVVDETDFRKEYGPYIVR